MAGNDKCAVTINLYDAATKQQLRWSGVAGDEAKPKKAKELDPAPPPAPAESDTPKPVAVNSLKYKVLGSCGAPDSCWGTVPALNAAAPTGLVSFVANLTKNTDTRIYIQLTYADHSTAAVTAVVPSRCTDTAAQNIYLTHETAPQNVRGTVNVSLEAHRCPGEGGEGRSSTVRFKGAWANVVTPAGLGKDSSKTQKETLLAATIREGRAHFPVPLKDLKDSWLNLVDATFEEEDVRAVDEFPIQFSLAESSHFKLVCRQDDAWAIFFFVNRNGVLEKNVDLQLKGASIPEDISAENGWCVVKGLNEGHIHVCSRGGYRIYPEEFHFKRKPAQGQVFFVQREPQRPEESNELVILELESEPGKGEVLSLRVVDPVGAVLAILPYKGEKRFSYNAGGPCNFQLLSNNEVVAQQWHGAEDTA
jgi:hypothetical protein